MFRKTLLATAIAVGAATPAFAQSADTWTGPYVGASVGIAGDKMTYPAYATFTPDSMTGTASPASSSSSNTVNVEAKLNSSGVIGGGMVGYDMRVGSNVVIGLVADFSGTSTKGEVALNGDSNFSALSGSASARAGSKLNYLGTVRARVGVPLAQNRFMLYVTGGFAFGRVTSSAELSFSGSTSLLAASSSSSSSSGSSLGISDHTNHTGWVAGAGAEYAVTDRIHFGVEYLHVRLNSKEIIGGTFATSSIPLVGGLLSSGTVNAALNVRPTLNIVRATISYRF